MATSFTSNQDIQLAALKQGDFYDDAPDQKSDLLAHVDEIGDSPWPQARREDGSPVNPSTTVLRSFHRDRRRAQAEIKAAYYWLEQHRAALITVGIRPSLQGQKVSF